MLQGTFSKSIDFSYKEKIEAIEKEYNTKIDKFM